MKNDDPIKDKVLALSEKINSLLAAAIIDESAASQGTTFIHVHCAIAVNFASLFGLEAAQLMAEHTSEFLETKEVRAFIENQKIKHPTH